MKKLVIIISLFLCGCNESKTNGGDNSIYHILSEIDENMTSQEECYYLIVPMKGCLTCVYKAEEFYLENKSSSRRNVKYVFTSIDKLKELKIKFGSDFEALNNTFVDHKNLFFSAGINLEYPTIVGVKKNQIISVEEANAQNFVVYNKLKEIAAL